MCILKSYSAFETQSPQQDAKQSNKNRVYQSVYHSEAISKQEIAYNLQMSLPTVSNNVKELIEQGLIREEGHFDSTGGRKATCLVTVGDVKVALGLEITLHYINLVVIDMHGHILHHKRTYEKFCFDRQYLSWLGEKVKSFVIESGIPQNRILGCGVALPGLIDNENNTVNSHVLEPKVFSLAVLESAISYPCLFVNDAHAACMAELRGAEQQQLTVYLAISDSIGSSVFVNGHPYLGAYSLSSGWTHTILYPGGRQCYCGKKGCVEAYCSAWTLAKECNGVLDDYFIQLEKDPNLMRIWEKYLEDLALLINNIYLALGCTIIVGGFIGGYFDDYYLSQLLEKVIQNRFDGDTRFLKVCKKLSKAAALGAALAHVDRYINTIGKA